MIMLRQCLLSQRRDGQEGCKLTKFRANVANCDAWKRLVGVHVSNLHNKAMRPVILRACGSLYAVTRKS